MRCCATCPRPRWRHGSGVSPQLVSDWKRGRRRPSADQVFALERALGAEPGSLSRHLGFVPVDADVAAVSGLADRVRARLTEVLRQPTPDVAALIGDVDDLVERAAERGLALELLRLAVEDFEREHGPFGEEELHRAARRLDDASRLPTAPAA